MIAALALAWSVHVASVDDDALLVNAIQNGGFELIADSTTDPPKRGAYWKGAFVPKPGVADDRIELLDDGNHALRLPDEESVEVSQVVTLFGPYADRFELHLRIRSAGDAGALEVRYDTVGGTIRRVIDPTPLAREADGFARVALAIGSEAVQETGAPLAAWGRITFRARGGAVLVDDVVGVHHLPRVEAGELRALLVDELREHVAVRVGPDGLDLIDRQTGYLTAARFDVVTGRITARRAVHGISGAHGLLRVFLVVAPPDDPLRPVVEARLRSHLKSLLNHNVHRRTGLFCLWDGGERRQLERVALSPTHFIEHAMDVSSRIDASVLSARARAACFRMADALAALHAAHDLPEGVPFGRGDGGNWFGRLPDKLLPDGELDWPKKRTYDQVWAIGQRRAWYHDFDGAVGLMRMWREDPRPAYLHATRRAIEVFDRKADATRYDLENDTDDHYGKPVEALLRAWRHSGHAVDELRDLAQSTTDFRLPRDQPWDRNVWVEGIRLGSFTTGDQPRAFRGPVGLHEAPPERNPESAGYAGYRKAIRELVRADLRRRLLDDDLLTDASSHQWEMIAACFLGEYIGPCSQGFDWEGDMGDLFSGPSSNAFRALARGLEISTPGTDRALLAWYAALHAHTVARYRRIYGYEVGMNPETGRRYGIPDRYLRGFSTDDPLGLAPVVVHAELVESEALSRTSARIDEVDVGFGVDEVTIVVRGTPSREVRVHVGREVRYHEVEVDDERLLRVDPDSSEHEVVALDEDGLARVTLPWVAHRLVVDVVMPTADGAEIEDLRGGVYERS